MRGWPHADPKKGMTRMGSSEPSRFLVSETLAKAWVPIAMPQSAAGKVEFHTMADRKRTDWVIDIITSPPKPPYLAASLGMAASDIDNWALGVSPDTVVLGGASKVLDGEKRRIVDRRAFLTTKEWFEKTGATAFDVILEHSIKNEFARGLISGEAARRRLSKIKTPDEVRRTFPKGLDEWATRLAHIAATTWESVA